MTQTIRTVFSLALGLLLAVSMTTQAQQTPPRFLTLAPPVGFPIIPLMEGWIRHEDGSRTLVFGYINRNEEDVDVPIGDNNFIEPAEFNGMQPEHFESGRGAQVFSVTLPPDRANEDVWWNIRSGNNNELLRIPGRARDGAYELDFDRPRPQGALPPRVGVGEDGAQSPGVMAVIADYPQTVRAGEEVELAVNAVDPSVRDTSDPRFEEPLDLGVHWFKHQGPGKVEFIRHPDAPAAENPYDEEDPRFSRWRGDNPQTGKIEAGSGVAKVLATFSEPGQYIIRTTVENWTAPDSSQGDQCCATNVFQRVTVR